MSREFSIYKEFTFGSGVGKSDLKVLGVSQEEETEYTVESIIGSGILTSDILTEIEASSGARVVISPGYMYIGDRELYVYGRKATQISRAICCSGGVDDPYSSGVVYIPLMELPDGIAMYYVPDRDDPYGSEMDNTGAAPINVSAYSSGELSIYSPVLDSIIYHDSGVDSVEGYTQNASGEVISGEVSEWPAYFSPLERYSVFPCYWRSGEPILNQDEFYYDFENNSIVLYNSGAIDKEYIIEFEGMNEPFLITELDLSPLEYYPGNNILCISPDKDNVSFTENPYRIALHASKSILSSEKIALTAEVLSERDNRLENETVRFRIKRSDVMLLRDSVYSAYTDFVEGEPYAITSSGSVSGVITDKVAFPSGMVYEGDVLISDSHRIEGYSYVRSAGYLCRSGEAPIYESGLIPDTAGYEISVTTDINGMATVDYLAPRVNSSSFDIEIEACVPNISGITGSGVISTIQLTLLSDEETTRYALDRNDLWRDLYISGGVEASGEITINGSTVILPIECTSPSSVRVVNLGDFMTSLYNDTEVTYVHPDSINSGMIESSGVLPTPGGGEVAYLNEYRYIEATFSGYDFNSGVTLFRYLDNDKITRGDARDEYVI